MPAPFYRDVYPAKINQAVTEKKLDTLAKNSAY
jgi:hypothetical protein